MIKSKSKHKSPSAVFLFAVPELTRSVGIQLNERVSLRRPIEILSSIQSRSLANAASTGHAYRAIRPKSIPGESTLQPTDDDIAPGFSKDIHEARIIRDAEVADPGIV